MVGQRLRLRLNSKTKMARFPGRFCVFFGGIEIFFLGGGGMASFRGGGETPLLKGLQEILIGPQGQE